MCGVVLAYIFLPKGLNLLFGFTPRTSAISSRSAKYLSFFLRTVFVFGLAFLTPVILVGLNLVGCCPASAWRPGGAALSSPFIFAAVAALRRPDQHVGAGWTVLGLVAI